MVKVSVIIPYHNVENYIEKCLESITGQTLKDIEIILINDKSEDKSFDIVKRFSTEDIRIISLSTEKHLGQAHARNIGLKTAKGEYISFIDSDDWVENDMLEKMYNSAKYGDTEITMCKARLYDDKTSEYKEDNYYGLKCLESFYNKVFSAYDTRDFILNINVVLWNKIYKKEFLDKINEKFPEGFIYEDLPFFFGTYLKAEKINIVPEYLYNYRQNRQYSTMQNIDKKIYDRIPMVSLTYEKLKNTPFYKEKEIDILSWIIDDVFHRFTLLDEKYYKEYFYMMKKLFQSFNLEGDEKYKLATCYCFEEYCSILKNNYIDFWKFLIEKYKMANKRVKEAQHERNETIKSLTEYWNDYKTKQEKEREEIIKWWQEYTDKEKASHKAETEKLYWDFHNKMIKQEYDLKKWQSQSLRMQKETMQKEYEWKLEKQKQQFKQALLKQKQYYENNFLLVRINIKINKMINQLKNKIKKCIKKN